MYAPASREARLRRFDTFELNSHAGELRKRGVKALWQRVGFP